MYRRKTKSLARSIPSPTGSSSDEETIENIKKTITKPLAKITSRPSQFNEKRDEPKAKKSKPEQIKPFATKYFEEICLKSGLILIENTENHILKCDSITFLKTLKTTLQNNVDFPRNVTEFVKGFKNKTKEPEDLKLFLIKNIYLNIDDTPSRVAQDSVLKIFLNVNCLQEHLIEYVFERATEFAIDNKSNQVQMLLVHLKFLKNIVAELKLVNGLQELLDVSDHSVRLDIITCLPDIICHLQHDSIALKLSDYLTEDRELTPAILDCLSYLCLPRELRARVYSQMLGVLRMNAPIHFFPKIVDFFLTGNNLDIDASVISGLREGLDWTVIGSQNVDIPSSQVMTVMSLKSAIMKSKNLATNWIKVINQIKTSDDHKPLDIIMLLVLYSTSKVREKVVEGIFLKRVKSGLFKMELLNVTFNKFLPVLREYLKDMLKIAKLLLRTRTEPTAVELAAHWFKLLFKELKDSQKTVIGELLLRDYGDGDDTIVTSLNVLTEMAREDGSLLKPHSLQIFALVDLLDNLTTDGIHRFMDLVCGLAFGAADSCLQADVHMLINKQLSSSDTQIKIRGIIGGIMAVKHLVFANVKDSEEIDGSFSEIDSLPYGPPKDAAMIVELICKSTLDFPELICLFYDELAEVFSTTGYVETSFLNWLSSTVTKDLTDIFIADIDESTPRSVGGIPISLQYVLNRPDEGDGVIGLNIAPIRLEESGERTDLRILPSLFRITQLIYTKQYDSDLSQIDALLGCGVLMPKIDPDEGLEDIDSNYFSKILDCYVHCINWFRELINAFCTQDKTYLRERVVKRLNTLSTLEQDLAKLIKSMSIDYKPPFCAYEQNSSCKSKPVIIQEKVKKIKQKGKSKKKDTTNDTSILPATLKTQGDTESSPQKASGTSKCKLNTNLFRLFDFEVIILFEEDLVMDSESDISFSQSPSDDFNIASALLILNEISPRLSAILPSKLKKKGFFSKQPVKQIQKKPEDVIDCCIKILPRICCFMESIMADILKSLDANDGVRDSIGMFTVRNAEAQQCLGSLFNISNIIFSWSGFQSDRQMTKLKDALAVLASRRDPQNAAKNSLKELIAESCSYILRYKEGCLLIGTAVHLVSFFKVLAKLYDNKAIMQKLVQLSLDMLSRVWQDASGLPEKGLLYNQQLDVVLSSYFNKPNVKAIKSISSEMKEQTPKLSEKNGVLETFKSISKSNFPLLFRATYGALYEAIKIDIDSGLTDREHLELWKNVALIMKDFIEILKIQENRTNLLTFLKKSIPLFRLFLSQGIPMMELKLKSEPDTVVEILRLLQHSTRFLHSLHCHSRLKKDTTFSAYLPQMKLTLETLVYKVKAALVANKCSTVFWMGSLKNKNLQGEVIPSQSSVGTDSEEGDDQLPEDDESVSSDIEDIADAGSKSASNIF